MLISFSNPVGETSTFSQSKEKEVVQMVAEHCSRGRGQAEKDEAQNGEKIQYLRELLVNTL